MTNTPRLGIFTLPLPGMTNFDGPAHVRKVGLNAFEPYSGFELASPDPENADKLLSLARAEGVTMPCFSVGTTLIGEHADEQEARVKGYADICARMHIPLLHHTLCTSFDPAMRARPFEAMTDEIVPRLRRIYDYADRLGVQCIYEDQGFVFNGAGRLLYLLRRMDRPAGVTLDVGNIAFVGERADELAAAVLPYVRHVHAKDYLHVQSLVPGGYAVQDGFVIPAVLGTGTIRAMEALKALHAAGYSGWYMLEHSALHDHEAEEKQNIDVMLRLLRP